MTSHIRHTIVLIGCLLLCACHNQNGLQVSSTNFEDEVEQQQNLVFSFNKELVPDSLTANWDSTMYIEFDPVVKGRFKWNSSSELIFSPEEGFSACTDYTAHLTKSLTKHSKKKFEVSDQPIHFHTAPLKVTSTHLSWVRGKNTSNVMVQLDLGFNYEVNLAEAANKLKLTSNSNPVGVSAVNNGNGKVLSLQFMPLADKDAAIPLQIDLVKGIPVVGTNKTSDKDSSIATEIPSRYNLSITDVTAQHTGTEGIITVSTSQPLTEADLKSMVAIEPAVPFDVTLSEAGFTITSGSFSPTQAYELNISERVEGAFGGKMKSDYTSQVTFGHLRPTISFANSKGMYLSGAGLRNIALNIVNIPSVEVTVIKVYENNLEHFLRTDKDWNYHYEREEGSSSYQYYNTEFVGDTVFSKSYETSKLPKQNAAHVLKLDFQDKIKDYNGVYVVRVKSKEHYWLQDSKIISISDIGLIVKEEQNNMYVFANSIKNATALPDVKITFVSTNNQKMYTATTDKEGVAMFKNISQVSPGFKVGLITAKMNDEFSFVWLSKTLIGTSRFDVGGRTANVTGLNAMIYPERNLYRPGETMSISAIVRDEQWNIIKDVPVKIKLVMPNGREFAAVRKILNEQGSCEVIFTPPPTALTGSYSVQVFTGNDVLLNTYTVSVEEFMPDRLKAAVALNKEDFSPGETVNAGIQADNLFGTPAAGRNYQCEMNLDKVAFKVAKYEAYDFSMHDEFKFNPEHRDGKTDEKGSASESFQLGAHLANQGMLTGNIMATIFDETGRPVHRYGHFTVYTQPVFVGMKRGDDYVSSRQPVRIPVVALDKKGTPVTSDVQVVFLRKEWHTVIQQDGSSYHYVSKSDDKVITNQKLHIAGTNTLLTVMPDQSGEYEVRIFLNGSENYVSRTFYAYGWGDTQYSSFEVDNEGNVEITADKNTYALGEDIKVLFTTPFDGRMLITLERNQLVKYYYVEAKNKSASLTIKAEEALLPNIYVTATLFRPMDGSDMPLTVAHGFKSVSVENKSNHLPVTITAVEKSRSKTKQTIQVKTQPGAFVTIAAVDEGILQIKNFKTPDPYEYFFTKVALGVNTYDIYPWLLPEIRTTLSSTGGDGADGTNGRVNPMFVNRVKNVSFWSGIKQADGSGNVRYDIDIPQFSGDIRIMAVAYKGKGFGSAEQHMKIADPVIINTALPRFLSPKDEVVMPVSLSNTTAKDAMATVTIKVSGPLSVTGQQAIAVRIPANREQRAVFNMSALPQIGAGHVTVTVKALGETFINETDISIRPPASLQKVTGSGFAAENSATRLNFTNNFLPASFNGKLVVGRSPLTQFTKNLSELVRYPYGCVEQTTSSVFPQLYYADMVKSINGTTTNDANPAYNIQQAINKLQSMQVSNGALTYWPGGNYESWWGSVYACHFLIEARKAGYEVNAGTVDRLLEYMKFKLYKKEVETYYYNGNMKKDLAPREVPYSLYVLAIAGQPQQSVMNYYKAHQELLSLDGKYLLSASCALAGQPTQAKDILPPAFSGEVANTALGGSFYSYTRDLALSLNVLLDTDPNNRQVGIMARQLSEQLKKERYLSTQENVFSFLAMGKIAKAANKGTSAVTISAGSKKIASSTGTPVTVDLKPYAGSNIAMQVKGSGGYYYFWETSGISTDGSIKEEDSYMRVRRTFFTRDGQEITNNTFRQNDLIVVRLSVEAQYDVTLDNVAITDMLPAGFEIENTRLNEMPPLKWIKEVADASKKTNTDEESGDEEEEEKPAKYKQPFDYVDIRDDRINMFTSVTQKKKNFYYMVRAVSPGVYQLGPVQADAMYDGNYHSYNGSGVIKVTDR